MFAFLHSLSQLGSLCCDPHSWVIRIGALVKFTPWNQHKCFLTVVLVCYSLKCPSGGTYLWKALLKLYYSQEVALDARDFNSLTSLHEP